MWDPEFALEKEILTDPYRSIQIHTRFWDPASAIGQIFWEEIGQIPSIDSLGAMALARNNSSCESKYVLQNKFA